MKVLLTAFEPFGGLKSNSSLEVFNELSCDSKILLPVSYQRAKERLIETIEEVKPDFVLSLGQAGGESIIRLEKFGLNYTRASIADNDGVLKENGKVSQNGVLAFTTNLDIEDLEMELKKCVPAYISLSAGGYICNTVYYTALEKMKGNALFVHLPFFEGQQVESSTKMALEMMVKAINEILVYIKTSK